MLRSSMKPFEYRLSTTTTRVSQRGVTTEEAEEASTEMDPVGTVPVATGIAATAEDTRTSI